MIHPIVRMYATAHQAADAVGRLREWGLEEDSFDLITPPAAAGATPAGKEDPVLSAILAALVVKADAKIYAEGVHRGLSLVILRAPFGTGGTATEILDLAGPVDSGVGMTADHLDAWDEASPLSSALGLPVLTGGGAGICSFLGMPTLARTGRTLGSALGMQELADPTFSVTSALGLLSSRATPLSSLLHLPLLLGRNSVRA